MLIIRWKVNIFLWFVVLRFVCGQQCPSAVNEEIARCVTPVAQYAQALGMGVQSSDSSGMEPLLPNMGKDVFLELCKIRYRKKQKMERRDQRLVMTRVNCEPLSLIRRFAKCVAEPKIQCPTHITLSLIDASYGYLCNEGYDTFMENANCLMELDQETVVRHCHDRTLKAIKNANEEPTMSLQSKMESMCRSLNYFAGCVKGPVQSKCGWNAWSVIVTVLRDTTRTLMPGCAFDAQVPDIIQPSTIISNEVSQSGLNGGFYSTSSGLKPPSVLYQSESPRATDRRTTGYINGARTAQPLCFGLSVVSFLSLLAYHSVVRWLSF